MLLYYCISMKRKGWKSPYSWVNSWSKTHIHADKTAGLHIESAVAGPPAKQLLIVRVCNFTQLVSARVSPAKPVGLSECQPSTVADLCESSPGEAASLSESTLAHYAAGLSESRLARYAASLSGSTLAHYAASLCEI